tara:strand:- start:80 stop:367 length:288 start_codon:yes stop_codon:yes gene_type:complete
MYQVIYSADYLDSKPLVKYFEDEEFDELEDFLLEEVERRVQWSVDHSPYQVDEEERQSFEEIEWSLIQILEGPRITEEYKNRNKQLLKKIKSIDF